MPAPEAVVIAIGEEVLRGEIVNTNASWLARRLTAMGFRVRELITVADDEEELVGTFREAMRRAPVVVASGGLGPTGDDLTAAAAARCAGRPLVESATVLAALSARLGRTSVELSPSSRRMSLVPEGAEVFPNPQGAAPGIHLCLPRADTRPAEEEARTHPGAESGNLYLLPGVPHEMMAIFDASVSPALDQLFPRRDRESVLLVHLCGWPESRADMAAREVLAPLIRPGTVSLGTRLEDGWVSLRLTARVGAALEEATELLAARFGESLWGTGDDRLELVVGRDLLASGTTLALAESCTGGMICSRLVALPGISRSLLEALVTYSNEAKTRLLGVDSSLLERHGAVSRECAEAMARGLRARSGADITLAVTGIAGPEGGTGDKPAGTVHFAVDTRNGPTHEVQHFGGERNWVRQRAASHGLWLLWRILRKRFIEA